MKKISRIQASQRILKIAKAVAEVEASNNKLTPFELAKVQKTVAVILASADLDNETLQQIASLDNDVDVNINNNLRQLMHNKSQLNRIKNLPLKSQPSVKKYLEQKGIAIKKPMKAGEFFAIVNELFNKKIANPEQQLSDENTFDEEQMI